MDIEALEIDRGPGSRPPRGRGRSRSPWAFRAVVLAMLGVLIWLFHAPILAWIDSVRLPHVRVLRVVESHPAAAGAVTGTAANGHIVAARRAALSADTPGRIVEMHVAEGSVVRKGDLVARLYDDEYAAALRRAEAEVETARAERERAEIAVETARAELEQTRRSADAARGAVAEAVANAILARDVLERTADLHEHQIAADRELEAARQDLDARVAQQRQAEAELHAAEAAVALAQSRVELAQADLAVADARVAEHEAARALAAATLEKTEVRAPFDGIVVLKDAEVGEVVSPNSQGGSNARGSVCTMVDIDSLEVQAEVAETSLAAVRIGAPVRVWLDAYPEEPYTGHVDRIWPTANRQKATVEVRIKLDQLDARLRPQMGVRIVFDAGAQALAAAAADAPGARPPAILLPADAIVDIAGRSGVFVLERDTVQFHALELGERHAGRVAVLAGLRVGQHIVLDPPHHLQNGDRVHVEEG